MDRCLKIEKEHEDLKRKFLEETKERKDLYNRLIELKGGLLFQHACTHTVCSLINPKVFLSISFDQSAEDLSLSLSHLCCVQGWV